MANDALDTRTRRANGPATFPVFWHLERQGGRSFTIGVYAGVSERWNATTEKWIKIGRGYFAEISERIIPNQDGAGSTRKRYDRNHELLYATRDEAHTYALRRVHTIVAGDRGKRVPHT